MERFKLIAAAHLFLLHDNRILLSRRFQTGYEDGNYSVPAGHLDGNESITRCMIREAKEEVGIILRSEELKVVHVMHRMTSNGEAMNFFVTATRWEGDPVIGEPHKCDDIRWFPLEDLPSNMVPYVRAAIEYFQAGSVYSEFDWQEYP